MRSTFLRWVRDKKTIKAGSTWSTGARLRGILEELEKAHIYIELLHNRNNSLERELWNVRQVVSELVEKAGR